MVSIQLRVYRRQMWSLLLNWEFTDFRCGLHYSTESLTTSDVVSIIQLRVYRLQIYGFFHPTESWPISFIFFSSFILTFSSFAILLYSLKFLSHLYFILVYFSFIRPLVFLSYIVLSFWYNTLLCYFCFNHCTFNLAWNKVLPWLSKTLVPLLSFYPYNCLSQLYFILFISISFVLYSFYP